MTCTWTIKGAYLNCLKFTGCLDFQLHFQNYISKNSFMKSIDEKIIFINIYDICKNYVINWLYLVHTLIYKMDIYKTPSFTKCFHMIFIIIVNYYSLMSYFPYVTCVSSQDIILLVRQCFLGFLVDYYSAIPFDIKERALECYLQRKQNILKNQKKTLIAVQVCTFKTVLRSIFYRGDCNL